jgi:hypothetical protein
MNEVKTITPASVKSLATSPMRVPVEHVGEATALDQGVLGRHGDGRLARARQPRQPDRCTTLAQHALTVLPRDVALVPGDVRAALLGHALLRGVKGEGAA